MHGFNDIHVGQATKRQPCLNRRIFGPSSPPKRVDDETARRLSIALQRLVSQEHEANNSSAPLASPYDNSHVNVHVVPNRALLNPGSFSTDKAERIRQLRPQALDASYPVINDSHATPILRSTSSQPCSMQEFQPMAPRRISICGVRPHISPCAFATTPSCVNLELRQLAEYDSNGHQEELGLESSVPKQDLWLKHNTPLAGPFERHRRRDTNNFLSGSACRQAALICDQERKCNATAQHTEPRTNKIPDAQDPSKRETPHGAQHTSRLKEFPAHLWSVMKSPAKWKTTAHTEGRVVARRSALSCDTTNSRLAPSRDPRTTGVSGETADSARDCRGGCKDRRLNWDIDFQNADHVIDHMVTELQRHVLTAPEASLSGISPESTQWPWSAMQTDLSSDEHQSQRAATSRLKVKPSIYASHGQHTPRAPPSLRYPLPPGLSTRWHAVNPNQSGRTRVDLAVGVDNRSRPGVQLCKQEHIH